MMNGGYYIWYSQCGTFNGKSKSSFGGLFAEHLHPSVGGDPEVQSSYYVHFNLLP